MHQLLQIVAILIVLLIVLRVSLRRQGKGFGLRARVTALNIATGALAGVVGALMLGEAAGGRPGSVPGGDEGYRMLASALRSVLPFTGLAFGGLGGYLLFGATCRWMALGGRRAALAWTGRIQAVVAGACLIWLALRLME